MNDLEQLLRIVLPVVGILLLGLAVVTFVTALGAALLPFGIVAAVVIAVWLWLSRK